MNCKVYITDEGFGPIVRQNAIIKELNRLQPDLKITCQLERHLEQAQKLIPECNFINRYNNITWHKTKDGFPDVEEIKKSYALYNERSDEFIKNELKDFNYDFVLSDFVYEAF